VYALLRLVLIALALCVAGPAGAALLPLQATYGISFAGLPTLSVSGSGIGNSNGLGGSSSIPAGIFAGNAATYVPVAPTFVGLTNLSIPANSVNNPGQTFNLGGGMGLSGSLVFNYTGGIALFPFGGGGTAMAINGSIPFKSVGGVWQYDAAKVFTAMGAALANAVSATATAFDNRTAAGQGTVQLVASGYVLVSNGALGNIPVLSTLTLTYTPEPGTLLLLGTGVASLASIGRRRVVRRT
jgi:hypothetical protein